MTESIVINHVTKCFNDKTVLNNVNLRLEKGSVSCLMGTSGSGKTTLIRIIMGILSPDKGEVLLPQGTRIACVFQEDRLIKHMSALENCRLVCADANRITEMLTELGLKDSMRNAVRTLSGGMARRVAIARALLAQSEVLILDEPFKGLDESTRMRTVQLVKRESRGKTVLVVTHDPQDAQDLNARIIRLE